VHDSATVVETPRLSCGGCRSRRPPDPCCGRRDGFAGRLDQLRTKGRQVTLWFTPAAIFLLTRWSIGWAGGSFTNPLEKSGAP
jgi:hypothetical protein